MANAGSLVCSSGATPVPDELHQTAWAGLSLLPTALLTYLTDGAPQLLGSAILNRLLDVDNLCAQPMTVPVMFSDADWVSKLADLSEASFPSPAFMAKVNSWIEYAAYTNFCQCNQPAVPPPPPHGANNLNADGCQPVYIQTAVAPWSCPSGACSVYVNTHNVIWTGNTAPTMYAGDLHLVGGTGPNTNNCHPTPSGWFTFPNLWTGAFPSFFFPDGQYGPIQASSALCTTNYTGPAPYLTFIASSSGDSSVNTSELIGGQFTFSVQCNVNPVGPDPTPTPPPAMPTQPCDSTNLCNINWLINSWITNTQFTTNTTNNQITDISIGATSLATPKYVLGSAHSVTGVGEFDVGGVVGILVQPTGFAPGTGLEVSDPTQYFDTGWVAFGNAEGWQANERVQHNGQVFLTQLQDVTHVGYNCGMSTGFTVTELVLPAPTPTP